MLLNYQIQLDLKMMRFIERTNRLLTEEIFLTDPIGNSKFGKDCKKRAHQKMRMEIQFSS